MFSDLAQGLLSFVQGMASELEIIPAQFRVALEQLGITSMQHLAHGVLSFPALQLALPGFQEADYNLLWFRIQREQTRPWTSPSSASLSTTSGATAVAELALTFPSRSEWCGVPLPQLQPTSSALPLVQLGSVAQSFSTTLKFILDDARKKQRVVKVGAGETEVVHTLWGFFLDHAGKGTLWDDFKILTVPQEASFREMFHEKLLAFAPSTLRGAISTWKRWLKWAARSEVDEPLLAIHVALFLREEARGPTGGRGLWTSLRFLEINLGFVLHCCSPLVSPWKHPESHHVPVQASPLTAKEWIELERHAMTFTDPRSQLCGVWLLMLAGVVRYAHLQRSLLSRDADTVGGTAMLGKCKTRGARRPLPWAAPVLLLTADMSELFQTLINLHLDMNSPQFVLPNLQGGPDWKAMSWMPTRMPLPKFLILSRRMFLESPFAWSAERVLDISTYSARRVLPSAADTLGLSPGDRAAVGGWSDPLGSTSAAATILRLRMPRHYSAVRGAMGTIIKRHIISRLAAVLPLSGLGDYPWPTLIVKYPQLLDKRFTFLPRLRPLSGKKRSEVIQDTATSAEPSSSTASVPLVLHHDPVEQSLHDDLGMYSVLKSKKWFFGSKAKNSLHVRRGLGMRAACSSRVTGHQGFGAESAKASGRAICQRGLFALGQGEAVSS